MRAALIVIGAVGLASLGMALRGWPGTPRVVIQPAAYVETGSQAVAVAWRALVRAELRRVGVIRAG